MAKSKFRPLHDRVVVRRVESVIERVGREVAGTVRDADPR